MITWGQKIKNQGAMAYRNFFLNIFRRKKLDMLHNSISMASTCYAHVKQILTWKNQQLVVQAELRVDTFVVKQKFLGYIKVSWELKAAKVGTRYWVVQNIFTYDSLWKRAHVWKLIATCYFNRQCYILRYATDWNNLENRTKLDNIERQT